MLVMRQGQTCTRACNAPCAMERSDLRSPHRSTNVWWMGRCRCRHALRQCVRASPESSAVGSLPRRQAIAQPSEEHVPLSASERYSSHCLWPQRGRVLSCTPCLRRGTDKSCRATASMTMVCSGASDIATEIFVIKTLKTHIAAHPGAAAT